VAGTLPTAKAEKATRGAVWREQALAEIEYREILVRRLEHALRAPGAERIYGYLKKARRAASPHHHAGFWSAVLGSDVERTWALINVADEALFQLAPEDFVHGQLPRLRRRAESLTPADDRRRRIDEIAQAPALTERAREELVTILHSINGEARKAQTRVRSFRNMLYAVALALTVAALLLAAVGVNRPHLIPLCFTPEAQVVCPTAEAAMWADAQVTGQPPAAITAQEQAEQDRLLRDTAGTWDIALIELLGLVAASLAAATTLRRARGTSTPYGVPLALAVLKLPSGALTAVLGLLFMRGGFVPGLTALDSPAQILAWAVIFGYSQQLFTRFVDTQAHSVLQSAGSSVPLKPAAA